MNPPSETLYIAGPMSGMPDFNRPAFNTAAAKLRDAGYQIINPAETELHPGSWLQYMAHGIDRLLAADGIALLDGWMLSQGAKLEIAIAERRGIQVRNDQAWLARAASIADLDARQTRINIGGECE